MKRGLIYSAIVLAIAAGLWWKERQQATPGDVAPDAPVIGLLMDSLDIPRWRKDRDLFVARAEALGARVMVQACQSDAERQVAQADDMLAKGADVLVVIPYDGFACARIVANAHARGVPVVAYDRLIMNSALDAYLSFDNERVGRLQARAVLDALPGGRGRLVYIGGAPTDNNAKLLHRGALAELQPAIERGDVEILATQWCENWSPEKALNHAANALANHGADVDAFLAANDGTAGGVVQALEQAGLAGQVVVTGQDAELAACRRLVEGTQTMTVYKPVRELAEAAAEIANGLARDGEITVVATVANGEREVPSVLLDPIPVTAGNLRETVIADGFQDEAAVYGR